MKTYNVHFSVNVVVDVETDEELTEEELVELALEEFRFRNGEHIVPADLYFDFIEEED